MLLPARMQLSLAYSKGRESGKKEISNESRRALCPSCVSRQEVMPHENPAAKRRKNAAHRVSGGCEVLKASSSEGAKETPDRLRREGNGSHAYSYGRSSRPRDFHHPKLTLVTSDLALTFTLAPSSSGTGCAAKRLLSRFGTPLRSPSPLSSLKSRCCP